MAARKTTMNPSKARLRLSEQNLACSPQIPQGEDSGAEILMGAGFRRDAWRCRQVPCGIMVEVSGGFKHRPILSSAFAKAAADRPALSPERSRGGEADNRLVDVF